MQLLRLNRAQLIGALALPLFLALPQSGRAGQQSGELAQNQPVSLLEALRAMLQSHPQIEIEAQQVEFYRGALRVATGQFDFAWNANLQQAHSTSPLTTLERLQALQAGFDTASESANLTTLNAGASKTYRNGVSISPLFSDTRNTDSLLNPDGLNQSQISFQVNVPLLRGRGKKAADALEISAAYSLRAELYALNHTIAGLMLQTALSFWNDRAALANLEITRQSEIRGQQFIDDTQALVGAGRVASGDLHELDANLEQRRALREDAEQTVIAAGQALALAMGRGSDALFQSPSAGEDLPTPPAGPLDSLSTNHLHNAVAIGLKRRGDLLALRQREQGNRALIDGAQNALRPVLNAGLAAGYSGFDEGRNPGKLLIAPFQGVEGANASASLTYSFAPKNNVARGQLEQATANHLITQRQSQDSARLITSDIVTSWSDVRHRIDQVKNAQASVRAFRDALLVEKEKFPLGRTTLTGVLTIEDRLTSAQQQQVSAELNYATALARLRFATGTLVQPEGPAQEISRDLFFSLPEF